MLWNEVIAHVADINLQNLQNNLFFSCFFLSINQWGGCWWSYSDRSAFCLRFNTTHQLLFNLPLGCQITDVCRLAKNALVLSGLRLVDLGGVLKWGSPQGLGWCCWSTLGLEGPLLEVPRWHLQIWSASPWAPPYVRVVMAGRTFGTTSASTSLLCSSTECVWIGGARMNLSPARV